MANRRTEIEKNAINAVQKNSVGDLKEYEMHEQLLFLTLYQIYYMLKNKLIERSAAKTLKIDALEKYRLFEFNTRLLAQNAAVRNELHKRIGSIKDIEINGCERCRTVVRLFDGRIRLADLEGGG